MTDEEIINYWKQGYSVEQITNMSTMVQKNKGTVGEDDAKKYVKNLVEKAILKYQS